MDWTDLHCFLVVASAGSIAGAARELKVNHSTVLRRLASLESALAVRLFDRLSSGYVLTSAGEDLAQRLAGLRDQVETVERQLQGRDQELSGILRLTTTDTLLHGLLMPCLAGFEALHPKVQLQVVVNNTFLNLTRREADVAVRGSNHPPENLVGRRVGHIRTAPYASRSLVGDDRSRSAELSSLPWVGPDEGLAHLQQSRWLQAHIPERQVRMRVDSLVGMVEAVRCGIGAAMLLCPLADAHDDLVQLAPPLPAMDTDIWVLTHLDLRRVARVQALTDFLHERLSADPRLGHDRRTSVGRQSTSRRRRSESPAKVASNPAHARRSRRKRAARDP